MEYIPQLLLYQLADSRKGLFRLQIDHFLIDEGILAPSGLKQKANELAPVQRREQRRSGEKTLKL